MAGSQNFIGIHLLFDILAALSSLAMTWLVYRWRLAEKAHLVEAAGLGYVLALVGGAAVGGWGFGTLNMMLSGNAGIGRSIIGALVGAILAVELFKRAKGIRGSTGLLFVPAFCTSVVVGRWDCFLAGLPDFTYGIATSLPWGRDFGDGVCRHPVQLYESFAMLAFLIYALVCLQRRQAFFMRNGFYLMVGWYAFQRFNWEYLKPYAHPLLGHNIFHLGALALMAYAAVMVWGTEHEYARQHS